MFLKTIRRLLAPHAECETLENGRLVVLRLTRPQARNAFSPQMCDTILKCTQEVSSSSSQARALILTGSSGMFCAGKDLKASLSHSEIEASEYYLKTVSAVKGLLSVPVPLIVSIEGACLGLGLEMALAGDLRVSGESSKIGFPEIGLNLFPGCGGSVLLPMILGNVHLASDLILTGRKLSAREALDINLISRVVSDGEAFDHARLLAEFLLGKNRELLVRAKKVIRYDFNNRLKDWMAVSQHNREIVGKLPEHLKSLSEFAKR